MLVDFQNYHVSKASPEHMGIFGFSWQEKVAKFMKTQLKGTAAAKKVSDFFQAGGLNVSLVNNMYNEYAALMATGFAPVDFTVQPDSEGNGGTMTQNSFTVAARISDKTNVDASIVLPFLRALFVLSRDGKIPFAKWNPAGFKQSTALRKTFSTEKGILEVAQSAGKTANVLMWIAGIGVGAYFLSQLKFLNIKGG